MPAFRCPSCGLQVPMEAEEFPFNCVCGTRSAANGEAIPAVVNDQRANSSPPRIEFGPGTHLRDLLLMLNISPDGCQLSCDDMMYRMNAWGPAGCCEHLPEIVEHLRRGYSKTNWPTVFAAGGAVVTSGLILELRVNPFAPVNSLLASLVEVAIRRAEKSASSTSPF